MQVMLNLVGDTEEFRGPPGPPGTGIMTSFVCERFGNIQQRAASGAFEPVGPWMNFSDEQANRVRIEVTGRLGHSQANIISYLTILRDGVAMHGNDETGFDSCRPATPDTLEKYGIDVMDVIAPGAGIVRYELAVKTLAGSVFLGRRASGDPYMINKFTMSLTGLL